MIKTKMASNYNINVDDNFCEVCVKELKSFDIL